MHYVSMSTHLFLFHEKLEASSRAIELLDLVD